MSEASTRTDGPDDEFARIIRLYFEESDSGLAPDTAELLAKHPALAGRLQTFFSTLGRLDPTAGAGGAGGAGGDGTWSSAPPSPVAGERPSTVLGLGEGLASTLPHEHIEATPPGTGGGTFRRMGDYVLLEELSRGGMGVVYRARQLSLRRDVAVKMILAGEFASPAEVARFHLEAESAAALDHPSIVPIYEVGEHDGHHYFSMKLIDGESLDRHVGRLRNDPRGGAAVLSEVALAVHYAHQHGILHRDLKPRNILIDSDGRPHVTDFGLAKRVGADDHLTQTGAILGTASYMSPEQARGNKQAAVTTASDVYGLGTLLYVLLTGQAPFIGDSISDILHEVQERDPKRPRSIAPGADRDLETVCLKCLEKDPPRHYDSAAAVAEELSRWLRGEPIQGRRPTTRERFVKWARRRPALAALAAVSIVAAFTLVGLGVALLYQKELKVAYEAASTAKKVAEFERGVARNALDAELRVLYYNRILSADRELRENNPHRAREFLDACPADSRQWEWHQLYRQCHAELLTVPAHDGWIVSVCFTPDGRKVVTSGVDQRVRTWDVEDGRLLRTWMDHEEGEIFAALSPDGSRLASVGGAINRPGKLVVRDIETDERLAVPAGGGRRAGVAFSPDGKTIAVANGESTGDRWVRLYDAQTGAQALSLDLGREPTHNPSFRPDGRRLMALVGSVNYFDSTGPPNRVRVWDATTGEAHFDLQGHSAPILFAEYSRDGRRIVTGGYDATVRVWDADDGRMLLVYTGHKDAVNNVAFSPDGRRVATASDDGSARIWEFETGRDVLVLKGHRGPFFDLAFSPDGRRLVSVGNDGALKFWDPSASPHVAPLDAHNGQATVAFRPEGGLLATGGADRTIKFWESRSGRVLGTISGLSDPVYSLEFSPDGALLASAGGDWRRTEPPGEIRLWDVATRKEIWSNAAHDGIAWDVAFSPDGERLASGGGEISLKGQEVLLWNTRSGKREERIEGFEGGVLALKFSPDGTRLSASSLNNIYTWDSQTHKPLTTLKGHTEIIQEFAYHPDGRGIFTCGADMSVRLWDSITGELLRTFAGHKYHVFAVAVSPDGRRVASGGADQALKLWDADTGEELITLRGHSGSIWSVAFSPDGRLIASADARGMVKIWDGTPFERGPP